MSGDGRIATVGEAFGVFLYISAIGVVGLLVYYLFSLLYSFLYSKVDDWLAGTSWSYETDRRILDLLNGLRICLLVAFYLTLFLWFLNWLSFAGK